MYTTLNIQCRICRKPMTIVVDQDPICPSCVTLGTELNQILGLQPITRFCAHYCRGETGWVEVTPENLVRIASLPWCTGLNLYDVVTLDKPYDNCCDRPVVGKVLQRTYNRKVFVNYFAPDDFGLLRQHLENSEVPCEGVFGPKDGRPGMLVAAYNDPIDIRPCCARRPCLSA
jgi:hypothetical protein